MYKAGGREQSCKSTTCLPIISKLGTIYEQCIDSNQTFLLLGKYVMIKCDVRTHDVVENFHWSKDRIIPHCDPENDNSRFWVVSWSVCDLWREKVVFDLACYVYKSCALNYYF
jgi:hypothetical protein